MSEYNKLKEKFDKSVKELRENCPHESLTEPYEVYWAIAHSAGYKSRFCERCGKQMYVPEPSYNIENKNGTLSKRKWEKKQ